MVLSHKHQTCALCCAHSHAKTYDHFANYFFKLILKLKCLMSNRLSKIKAKAKALQHFKVNPVLKIDFSYGGKR